MYEILNHLYLSNYADTVQNVSSDFFVVNCTSNLPMVLPRGLHMSVNDDVHEESINTLSRALPIIVEHIDIWINSGNDVLVYSDAGQQRSATVLVAYLMYKTSMTIDQAIECVKSKKPDVFSGGINFQDSLIEYEKYIANKNSAFQIID